MTFEIYVLLAIFSIAFGSSSGSVANAFLCFGGIGMAITVIIALIEYLNTRRG